MIIRFGYEPIFHVGNTTTKTLCGRPTNATERWRKYRRAASATVGDEQPETTWGAVCGACLQVLHHGGDHSYDEYPRGTYPLSSRPDARLVDILRSKDLVKVI